MVSFFSLSSLYCVLKSCAVLCSAVEISKANKSRYLCMGGYINEGIYKVVIFIVLWKVILTAIYRFRRIL